MKTKFLLIRKVGVLASAIFLIFGVAAPANAAVISLFDWGLNIDGAISMTGDPIPAGVDASGFDFGTGLGTIQVSVTRAGPHNVVSFFDHEIDEDDNTFFNEAGATGGAAATAGQAWEIDEPGFVFGDIYDNFLDNTLDNINAIPVDFEDDVSMAMGFDFTLAALETATISFFVGLVNDAPGFYLEQIDDDSQASIFFWGDVAIDGGGIEPPVPLSEPGTLLLFGAGLLALGLRRRSLRIH